MKQTPHVALLPSPGMGHIIPMLEFAKRLIIPKHNLSLSLIIPDSGLHPDEEKPFLESLPRGINLIFLPRPNLEDIQSDHVALIGFTIARSLSSLRNVIGSLAATTNLVALVVDLLGSAAFDVAKEFNLSPYMFFPSNAMALSLFLYLPKLDAKVSCPYKDVPGRLQIPGCTPLRVEDLLVPLQDRDSLVYKWVVNEGKRFKTAEGIVVNTFNDIESGPIKALQQENYPPIFPIGPLVRQTDTTTTDTAVSNTESGLKIMKWLDEQPHDSILFVSFGSVGFLSHAQIHELAFGLEMSETRFLWVVRCPNKGDPSSLLPEDFLERTKGQGLLVSDWAPQVQILSHGSTGGFITHCGWNSVLESVVNGVPMIAWPLRAEQKMNAAMLSEDLKIALRVGGNDNGDGLVRRMDIANFVKNLMEGDQGNQLRKNTRALKDAAKMALRDDGPSSKSLADLVRVWEEKTVRDVIQTTNR